MGEIIYPPRALEYYTAGMLDTLGITDSRRRVAMREPAEKRMKVVADMGFGAASVVLPQVAAGWGLDLISLSPFLDAERTHAGPGERQEAVDRVALMVAQFKADFGVAMDPAAERATLVTPSGRVLDGNTALHAMIDLWCSADDRDAPVAVPLTASRVVESIAGRHGCKVLRSGRSRRALATTAIAGEAGFAGDQAGGYMFTSFLAAYDAVLTLGMLARQLLESGKRLDDVVAALPEFHLVESSVGCPASRKGAVMRAMAEAVSGLEVEMTEGIRVAVDGGWALVLPHPSEPYVRVFAEGDDDESARELLSRYTSVVEEAARAKDGPGI
jgi:mannose-1-phosphate guanylyltransferase/phosphomannomutase